MKEVNKEQERGNPWLMWGLVILVVLVLAAMAAPVTLRCSKKADMTATTSNAKQVFYLLIEFDQDHGEFPGDNTARIHPGLHGGPNIDLTSFKGEFSNDYLGQLIAGGYCNSEEIFVAPWEKDSSRKADNVIDAREEILKAGECGFAYVKNQSTSDNSGRPVLLAPMAGDGEAFDSRVYDGKAVVLRIDGAVKQLLLNKTDNKAKIGGGKTIFDGGEGAVWGNGGFDKSNLCYAKKSPGACPIIFSGMKPTDWLFVMLAVLLLVVVLRAVFRSRKRRLAKQSKIAS